MLLLNDAAPDLVTEQHTLLYKLCTENQHVRRSDHGPYRSAWVRGSEQAQLKVASQGHRTEQAL